MSAKLVDDIFEKYLTTLLPTISNPCLSLYGGEPFLPGNEAIIRRMLEHSGRRTGMAVTAVTNGITVDAMPNVFGPGPGKIGKVQISLDGGRRFHDGSRTTTSGDATFDRILKNIQLLIKQETYVDVRINVDKSKVDSLPQLLEELRAKRILDNKFVHVYAYPLHDGIATVDSTGFITIGALSRKLRELGLDVHCPISLHANDFRYLFDLKGGVGLMRTAYCMQTYQQYLVVDPVGDLYACSEEAGYPEWRVGHIGEAGVEFFPLRDSYKARHLANLPSCLACAVALACGGQCGMRCRVKTGDMFKPYCDDIKDAILSGIKLAYENHRAIGKMPPIPAANA